MECGRAPVTAQGGPGHPRPRELDGLGGLRAQLPFVRIEVDRGWCPIVERLASAGVHLTLATEKWGWPRLYLDGIGTPEVEAALADARREAANTCLKCGAPGEMRAARGLRQVLCPACGGGAPRAVVRTRRVGQSA